jgi:DNA-binding LytR/AlgR family response regulator
MKLLIVIGDMASRSLIKNQLKECCRVSSIVESDSAEDALFLILEKRPAFVIANDTLPFRSGFELVNLLKKRKMEIPFIVLSNDPKRAIEAIRNQVFDFLVYPFSGNKLVKSVERCIDEIEKSTIKTAEITSGNSIIRIKTTNGFRLIDIGLLSHCEADGSYTKLYFSDGAVEHNCSNLGKVEKVLKEFNFVRINRATIVNLLKIKTIDSKNGICTIDSGCGMSEFRITDLCLKKLIDNSLI